MFITYLDIIIYASNVQFGKGKRRESSPSYTQDNIVYVVFYWLISFWMIYTELKLIRPKYASNMQLGYYFFKMGRWKEGVDQVNYVLT